MRIYYYRYIWPYVDGIFNGNVVPTELCNFDKQTKANVEVSTSSVKISEIAERRNSPTGYDPFRLLPIVIRDVKVPQARTSLN